MSIQELTIYAACALGVGAVVWKVIVPTVQRLAHRAPRHPPLTPRVRGG